MKLIVGLGNPGKEYIDSRHNIGFRVVDALSKSYDFKLKSESGLYSMIAKARLGGEEAVLAKPLTFMNLSGVAVKVLLKRYKSDLTDLLVVCDDMDLELGRLKLKASGSSAGQKGLASIIEYLGSNSFSRLRIGIGRPGNNVDPSRFVLSPFNKKEKELILDSIERACDCAESWISEGIEKTMNIYNRI